jgi:hypothetical protein
MYIILGKLKNDIPGGGHGDAAIKNLGNNG